MLNLMWYHYYYHSRFCGNRCTQKDYCNHSYARINNDVHLYFTVISAARECLPKDPRSQPFLYSLPEASPPSLSLSLSLSAILHLTNIKHMFPSTATNLEWAL